MGDIGPARQRYDVLPLGAPGEPFVAEPVGVVQPVAADAVDPRDEHAGERHGTPEPSPR